ncbi:YGR106C [Saccharomyces arboricola H-6]|uniref:YGR106C n=1 Tax=Saccharomyces arboricola (strain H-6 / AS 2.3317 / CBS 10644) TaxID=1160507 RepID=J8Q206_SACAR|nr:YGR106C [Saccharomyces arboricola H-6]
MVFGQLYAFFVFTLSWFIFKTVQADSSKERSSFISLDDLSKLDTFNSNSSTIDVISSVDSAVAVFGFDNFQLMNVIFKETYEGYPFFDKFFTNDVTFAINGESSLSIPQSLSSVTEQFKIDELPQSVSELLYDHSLDDKSIVLFNFTSSNYDLNKLDEFIESCLLFLEDKSNDNLTVIINSAGNVDVDEDNFAAKDILSHHDNDGAHDGDDDILSSIWTEGLLMCLIVSALLLFILIIALSWISSLDITYGALEKSTNPIKKNN